VQATSDVLAFIRKTLLGLAASKVASGLTLNAFARAHASTLDISSVCSGSVIVSCDTPERAGSIYTNGIGP
jgi:hypothetical protein